MFVQGKRPALSVPVDRHEALRAALRRAGYEPHTGHRYQRPGEIAAWSLPLRGHRHVHVQEVRRGERIDLYAHTEPHKGWRHVVSALTDQANFGAGARKLRQDLHRVGWF